MEGKSMVVCILLGILGLVSTAVGLAFEVMPDKTLVHLFYISVDYDDYCTGTDCVKCVYFRSGAFFMVFAGIVCVIVAQIIITVSADCGCCTRVYSSSALQALAILAFFFSCLSCIAATIAYLVGAATQYGVQFPDFGHFFSSLDSIWVDNVNCYKVKHGVFAAAAAFSFAAVALGITSYLALVHGGRRRRRLPPTTTDTAVVNNGGNAPGPGPVDLPIAIALPDVPATPVRRSTVVERHRTPSPQRRVPVMVEA